MVAGERTAGTAPTEDLEIERDLAFQHREWRVHRLGWAGIALIVLAALAGVLGAGPLSNATAESGPLQLDYARFERRHAPAALEVTIAGNWSNQEQIEFWVSLDYLEGTEITSIVSEPEAAQVTDERVVQRVAVADHAREATLLVAFEHDDPGVKTGEIAAGGGPEIAFWQVVYPERDRLGR